MPDDDNIFGRCFDLIDRGVDQNGLIAYLHDQGLDLCRTVLITNKLYSGSFSEIMALVANHPSWREEVLALNPRSGSIEERIKELVRAVE